MRLLRKLRNPLKTPETDNVDSIPISDAYSVLSNERRRHVINYLVNHKEDEIPISDVANHLATQGDDYSRCYISIIQQHAPRLHDAGAVRYNEHEKVVEPLSNIEAFYEAHLAVKRALN
ncbi:hypothetical protein ACFQH6_15085 [Halobacteriaceae archaeon GCM10025711]